MPSLSPSSRPPTPASHPYILFSMTSDGMEYPFGQFGSAVLGLSPPSSCCTPSLLAGRTEREAEKSLAWCKHCSATIKTSACYQRSSHPNPKHSTLPATRRKINSVLTGTRTDIHPLFHTIYVMLRLHSFQYLVINHHFHL